MRAHKAGENSRAFGLVLCGGGARGLAHAGVLRALAHHGYYPSAVVGVSMGAWVAAAYGLNDNWYRDLIRMDANGFPNVPRTYGQSLRARIKAWVATARLALAMLIGWGAGSRYLTADWHLLNRLTHGRRLEEARIPIAMVATDLRSGERVLLTSGKAADAMYASSALAGFLPPLECDGKQLADGGYSDLAPIDVARSLGAEVVLAVDPGQPLTVRRLRNGLEATVRAVDICNREHTRLRLARADLVLQPHFPDHIETLDFTHMRSCTAAGVRAVRANLSAIQRLLEGGGDYGSDNG